MALAVFHRISRLWPRRRSTKIDPEFMEDFLPRSGLSESDLLLEPLDPDPGFSRRAAAPLFAFVAG